MSLSPSPHMRTFFSPRDTPLPPHTRPSISITIRPDGHEPSTVNMDLTNGNLFHEGIRSPRSSQLRRTSNPTLFPTIPDSLHSDENNTANLPSADEGATLLERGIARLAEWRSTDHTLTKYLDFACELTGEILQISGKSLVFVGALYFAWTSIPILATGIQQMSLSYFIKTFVKSQAMTTMMTGIVIRELGAIINDGNKLPLMLSTIPMYFTLTGYPSFSPDPGGT